ncbi:MULTISPECIES: hypothetical protein [unclassified Iodidimonas]|jgi:protein-tyrosine-phosphatase|uniref:arsenate-mycothiol transferase ArsC n=1 Tax=unclassified Iodidimonas TaxID=2626145 RepID=UPI0024827DFE|nr:MULTISPECIES: hypothetical protein [unclassified Iodidimonas]
MIASPADPAQPPRHILFICNRNAVRSPMAQALAERHGRHRIRVSSAGLDAGTLDPFAVAVMDEAGFDISGHQPHSLLPSGHLESLGEHDVPDLIISLTPEAHHRTLGMIGNRACLTEYWPTIDPTLCEGNREQRLDAYRAVRDKLAARIKARFEISGPGHL